MKLSALVCIELKPLEHGLAIFSSISLPREWRRPAPAQHHRPFLALNRDRRMTSTANQYGSLIFCSRCGTLLDLPGDEDQLVCDGCGQVEDATGA